MTASPLSGEGPDPGRDRTAPGRAVRCPPEELFSGQDPFSRGFLDCINELRCFGRKKLRDAPENHCSMKDGACVCFVSLGGSEQWPHGGVEGSGQVRHQILRYLLIQAALK